YSTWLATPYYSDPAAKVGRSCYCVNGGIGYNDPNPVSGPADITDSESPAWQAEFARLARPPSASDPTTGTGISIAGSVVRLRQVTDGTSKTYFAGEKKISADNYTNGLNPNDNESLYMGANGDISCW